MDRLDAMHMFVRVVETGSFTKVAQEFSTTQPTVTKQVAALPRYVAQESLKDGRVVEVLKTCRLPEQEIHAVYPSPRLVPQKVQSFIAFLQGTFDAAWWENLPHGG